MSAHPGRSAECFARPPRGQALLKQFCVFRLGQFGESAEEIIDLLVTVRILLYLECYFCGDSGFECHGLRFWRF